MPEDRLLTTKEAAGILTVKIRRVQALIETGRLPAVRMGRDWFIRESDVRAFRRLPSRRPRAEELAECPNCKRRLPAAEAAVAARAGSCAKCGPGPEPEPEPEPEDEFCSVCGEDLSDRSSHYHCPNCGEVTGMFGHWGAEPGSFTCQPKAGEETT